MSSRELSRFASVSAHALELIASSASMICEVVGADEI